jgi:hypothetical protein
MPRKATVPVGSPGARGANPSSSPSPSQRGSGGGGLRRENADAAAAAAQVTAAAQAAIVTAAATAAANAAQAAVRAPVMPTPVTLPSAVPGGGGGGGGAASLSAGAAYGDYRLEFHDAFARLSQKFDREYMQKTIEPLLVQTSPGYTEISAAQRTLLTHQMPSELPLTKAELTAAFTDSKGKFLLSANSWNEEHKKIFSTLVDTKFGSSGPSCAGTLTILFHAHSERQGAIFYEGQSVSFPNSRRI